MYKRQGWLEQDPGEYYYIYAQTMDGRTQYGLTMCCHYEDYLSGAIKKHELTRPDKEEDRMIHVRNQKANIMFEAKWGWNQQGIKEHETMQNPGDYYEYVYGGLYNYLEANDPGASHAALANAANSHLIPVLGNYMAYKIPDGTTLIDPATGKLNSDAKLLYADNYDDYLFTKQFRQEYTLSISGGNDNMDYYVSGSFLEDPSYVIMSGFKRYSGRAAFNAQATKWLKVGTNLSYSRRDIDSPGYSGANTGNVFLWTMWQNPTVPYYARDLDGNIRYNACLLYTSPSPRD